MYTSFSEASQLSPKNTLLVNRLDGSEPLPSGYLQVEGVPTILTSIVLSPFRKDSPFSSQEFRKHFAQELREVQNGIGLNPGLSKVTDQFYPTWVGKNPVVSSKSRESIARPAKRAIRVMLHSSMPRKENEYARQLLSTTFDRLGLKYEFVPESESVHVWEFDTTYDVRVPRVNIGGNLLSEAIRIMFCSKMGVSFPDPSKRICEITDQFESDQSTLTFQEYGDSFNQILIDDASVLPLFHTGWTWFLSPEIKPTGVSPSMAIPRFDLIELR
jgi:hypothetical protein